MSELEFRAVKKQFIELLLKKGALRIAGDEKKFFLLKSGRQSPYFINFGLLNDGESLSMIKKAYSMAAKHALEQGVFSRFEYVFGPAYKGINLAALTCEGLHELHEINCHCLYDRKEEKTHGEAGSSSAEKVVVGAGSWKSGSAILLVDDVITTGKAKYEALEKIGLLEESKLAGLLLGADRQEKMGGAQNIEGESAVQALEKQTGMKTCSILSMKEIFQEVKQGLSPEARRAWIDYSNKYGVVRLNE